MGWLHFGDSDRALGKADRALGGAPLVEDGVSVDLAHHGIRSFTLRSIRARIPTFPG